jgi:endonuclease G, mitochondrial
MDLLTPNEVRDLARALQTTNLDPNTMRAAIFQGMPPGFSGSWGHGLPPNIQWVTDINRLVLVERFTNGDIALEIYLRNLDLVISNGTPEQQVIREMLNRVLQRAQGSPKIDVAAVPELKEKIIHIDDTVTFAFMEAGVRAGAAVMKLRVPRHENGQPVLKNGDPMIYNGTGWLLTPNLVVTNHHVINARSDGEPIAGEPDLRLQTLATKVQFDFDAEDLAGSSVTVSALEAWEPLLDYAILRIPATTRTPLMRARDSIRNITDPVPVNIIQHPGGRSKRYAIRNNLVSASDATELRYFTDTEGGSSGSPVLNDRWEVVALHRASKYVTGVRFQGKETAYVNVGTHLTSILADLRTRYPAIAAEIQ